MSTTNLHQTPTGNKVFISVSSRDYDRLIEIACNHIRSRFDNCRHGWEMEELVIEAKSLGLPTEFVKQMESDMKIGRGEHANQIREFISSQGYPFSR